MYTMHIIYVSCTYVTFLVTLESFDKSLGSFDSLMCGKSLKLSLRNDSNTTPSSVFSKRVRRKKIPNKSLICFMIVKNCFDCSILESLFHVMVRCQVTKPKAFSLSCYNIIFFLLITAFKTILCLFITLI